MVDKNTNNGEERIGCIDYRAMIVRVYSHRGAVLTLRGVSYGAVLISAAMFILRVCLLLFGGEMAFALKLLAVAAVPFLLVSLLRKIINAQRPYELIGDFPRRPKNKSGESFPSRHTFSAFLIATLLLPWSVTIAAALYLLSVMLAVARVLLGIHFVRDVVAGAVIGIVCGAVGIAVIGLI